MPFVMANDRYAGLSLIFAVLVDASASWHGHFIQHNVRECNEEGVRNWKAMDAHVRRRLRAIVIRQKKRPRYLYRHLLSRDVSASQAAKTAWSSRGIWHRSARSGMHLGYRIDWFTEHLVSLTTEWYRHNLPNLVSPASERQLTLFAS